MAISINPIFPVLAAEAAAPELVLQPGTVIDAQVLKILAGDVVRIAIANLSIEVLSEIPLQVGQTLQLAVSQTPAGIRLALTGQTSSIAGEGLSASADHGVASVRAAPACVTLSPDVRASEDIGRAAGAAGPKNR